ncbi:class I SAM-dependent methyltransferase [Photobacterium sp. ZSDE20]|uniref:Class I SAM-dependent methyltransferase n=1 Tax=Photobacterium pectinilyticum TaxID=2906793 RepID=A0ABT1N517_9GAMM|nr:class I SAM-dependent methyltransferase [Photobacterium sp. ZSDE20]MCQ1059835.1 class I SAM-dependent methyltransferase [Photobacterium sp. ZSDE20]MDD1826335.1 class I SAM-dependent methyltransferase [Photobacterium sp. ZSDE20]
MKLSKRLKKIEQMVTPNYTHVWDCCCDHGFIGAALLSRQAAKTVHFVDIVPDLMAALEQKLQRFYPEATWKVHCQDVAKLPLNQYSGKQLVIIAGVGGDLMSELVEAIHQDHQNSNIDFLLCPVNHQFTLRKTLIKQDFGLEHEVLIEDNRRFYEIMLVSSTRGDREQVSAVGSNIWQSDSTEQAEIATKYKNKTLGHYRRIQQGNTGDTNIQTIIDGYCAITV